MPRPSPTAAQKRVLDAIGALHAELERAPTFHEVMQHLGLRSPATVYEHVEALREKGWLRTAPKFQCFTLEAA